VDLSNGDNDTTFVTLEIIMSERFHDVYCVYARPDGNVLSDEPHKIDEHTSESDIRSECPNFFKTPHGKRETYTMYRGAIIVRNTVRFSGCEPTRMTAVYLFDTKSKDTVCLAGNNVTNIRQAKRLVDRVLALNKEWYGMTWDGTETEPTCQK